MLADVILDIPTASLDTPYTYLIPDTLKGVSVGACVLVSFGNRKACGLVSRVYEGEITNKTKPIEEVLTEPYFDSVGVECAEFLAKRYIAPLAICMRLFTPPGSLPRAVKSREGTWEICRQSVGKVDDRWIVRGKSFSEYVPRSNATKQSAILSALEDGDIRVSELTALLGSVSQALKSLESAGVIEIETRRRNRAGKQEGFDSNNSRHENRELTPSQKNALSTITEASREACGRVVLVDGVTGSGKTEIYLQAIEQALKRGQGAIVLVPEISLTPQTVARFRGRFGETVAVIHSNMSAGERFDEWESIRRGDSKVVVGARSALFTPVQNLGLIVIDEEHETTYKQENSPRYVSRDVAEWLVKRHGGTLILGSATPSIDALHSAFTKANWSSVVLSERVNGKPLPNIEVIDMALEFKGGSRSIFSKRLQEALIQELSAGHKAVLLLNKRGFSSFLLCRDCGFVPECRHCSTTLTYHEIGSKLACHHCGFEISAPSVCPACGSPYLKKFGVGTQRVEAELRSFIAAEIGITPDLPKDIEIVRMDRDTTSKAGAHQELLERFGKAESAILLGTQMIAKGLDFDDVTLVGVINADTQLHLPDFRAAERTFDLIEQVAGRAGRAELKGHVLIQTYEANNFAIRSAAKYDREEFLRTELPKRKTLGFPPFVRMANVLVWGKDESLVANSARNIYSELKDLIDGDISDPAILDACTDVDLSGWEVLPAGKCAFERERDDYRWHVVVKCPINSDLSTPLRAVWKKRTILPEVSMAIDIDPIDVL